MKAIYKNYFNKKGNDNPTLKTLEKIPVFKNLNKK